MHTNMDWHSTSFDFKHDQKFFSILFDIKTFHALSNVITLIKREYFIYRGSIISFVENVSVLYHALIRDTTFHTILYINWQYTFKEYLKSLILKWKRNWNVQMYRLTPIFRYTYELKVFIRTYLNICFVNSTPLIIFFIIC